MVKTVITTAAVAFIVLAVDLAWGVLVRPTVGNEYLSFGLMLLLFVVILVGAYAFVVRATRRRE